MTNPAPSRRSVLTAGCAAAWAGRTLADDPHPALRVGLTPVFLDSQVAFVNL